jgi:hypothetical protein
MKERRGGAVVYVLLAGEPGDILHSGTIRQLRRMSSSKRGPLLPLHYSVFIKNSSAQFRFRLRRLFCGFIYFAPLILLAPE